MGRDGKRSLDVDRWGNLVPWKGEDKSEVSFRGIAAKLSPTVSKREQGTTAEMRASKNPIAVQFLSDSTEGSILERSRSHAFLGRLSDHHCCLKSSGRFVCAMFR